MATDYAKVGDIADFLKVGIDETTIPNIAQVEKIIKRVEDRIDRRTGHAWRQKTITNEQHDIPLIYNMGWGTMISLQHRSLQELDNTCFCDKLELWGGGATGQYTCRIGNGTWEELPARGEIYIRGHLFSVLRKNRVRITYRFGGEPGDCWASIPIPGDIEDAAVKLTSVDLLTSAFRFDLLPRTDLGFDLDKAVSKWESDADRIIRNREEIFVVTV